MEFTLIHSPPEGERWICEIDGRLHSVPKTQNIGSNASGSILAVMNYACAFDALNDKPHEVWRAPQEQQPGGLFLSAPSTQAKAVVTAYYQNGLASALEVLAKNNPLLNRLVRLLAAPQVLEGDHMPLLASHPTSTEVAVAVREDQVRLIAVGDRLATDFKTKHRVICLAWRPYATHLAAGCVAGLILWTCNYQENKINREFSEQSMCMNRRRLLKTPNNCPVATFAWHPQGDYLVAAAGSDLYLVRPETEHWWPLPRGLAVHLMIWSPCGSRILTASYGTAFHIWNAATWTSERWTVSRGRLLAACFSPNGRLIIFGDEAGLYCLPMDGPACLIEQTRVSALSWNGNLLAAVHHGSDSVHVYGTQVEPQLNIRPHCIIGGKDGETPTAVEFSLCAKRACVLLILWSSGRIQSFPFTSEECYGSSSGF